MFQLFLLTTAFLAWLAAESYPSASNGGQQIKTTSYLMQIHKNFYTNKLERVQVVRICLGIFIMWAMAGISFMSMNDALNRSVYDRALVREIGNRLKDGDTKAIETMVNTYESKGGERWAAYDALKAVGK